MVDGSGCDGRAITDPALMAADRPVARCAPGGPEPRPLPNPTVLRIGIRSPTEDLAPLLLALHFGELARENLEVELVELDDPDELIQALDTGAVDAVAGQLDAPFFDAVFQGSGVRLVLGGPIAANPYDTTTAQAGLWLRADVLEEDDWRNLESEGVAVDQGIGDATVYPIHNVMLDEDMSLNDVDLRFVGGEEAAAGLLTGEYTAAWLTDPHWLAVAQAGRFELAATLPAAESLSGILVGERLLDPSRDRLTGLALCRALIRTINTYLALGYQDDSAVVGALVEATGQQRDEVVETPAWVFDWEVRLETVERIQLGLVPLGGVLYEDELPDERLVDRSLYEEAVGSDR